jgi:hypothetical protein
MPASSYCVGDIFMMFGTKAEGNTFYIDQIYFDVTPSVTVSVTDGTASPVSGWKWGDVVTLTPATAPEGKLFSTWNVTGSATKVADNQYKVLGDVTFTAVFVYPEQSIPGTAAMIKDYAANEDPWYNDSFGTGNGQKNWAADYEDRCGVISFGAKEGGNSWNRWALIGLNGLPAGYTTFDQIKDLTLNFRIWVNGDSFLNMEMTMNGAGTVVGLTPDVFNAWTTITVPVSDLMTTSDDFVGSIFMMFGTKAEGNTFYIDQIYFDVAE